MGISKKGNGRLTPIHKNKASKDVNVVKERPFYWNSVKHSELGDRIDTTVKSIKMSKEEIERLYPRPKKTISSSEMLGYLKKGMSVSDISAKCGIATENLVMIAKTYGLSAKLYQNSKDEL